MSKINIVNEDCISGMQRHLSDSTVNVIVTSPPYNLGIKYGEYNDHISRQNYLDWMRDVAFELHRVLDHKGSLFLNLGSKPTDPWVAHDVANVFRQMFKLQNTFVWVKSITLDDGSSYGHFKPLNSSRFVNDCWEYVFHFTKTGNVPLNRLAIGVPYTDKSNVKRWKGVKSDCRCRGNTWFIPYETITTRKDRPHPATFPVQLVTNCLLLHGVEGIQQVLDPFMGIGSTAKACKELDLNCVGFEIDSEYCKEALGGLR